VDVQHIKLELSVDMKLKLIKGSCITDFKGLAPSADRVSFDAIDLKVDQVMDGSGAELRYDHSDGKLVVYLRKNLQPGEESRIVVKYTVQEPRAGLYFIAPDKDYPQRPWQLWTQGQDEDNRYWFPCHDAPNEKATTEMVVTVDEAYTAISNGKLLAVTHDTMAKRRTYHWKQGIPHSSYLVTLCVGEFTEITDSWKNSKGEEIPVSYYAIPGREKETKHCFGKTPKMMSHFSKVTGVDYPYEKYAQVVAAEFIYGGMENTSATTQTEYTLHPETLERDHSSEYLVAHELAHQWFGDLLTCKDWRHAWLNEGFATYFENVWTEFEHGRDEYLMEMYTNEKGYKAEAGAYQRPIVTNVYLRPSDIFDGHLYEKGGRVLHMLRKLLGDDTWWKGVNVYLTRHRESVVETVDFQRAMEEVSGRSLDWFFEQWLYKAGHPDIKAVFEWIEDKKQGKLTLTQKQPVGDFIPLFRFSTRFKAVLSSGEVFFDIDVDKAEQTFWFSLAEKPKFVALNCENTILGNWDFAVGRDMFVAQLAGDTDPMGRIAAAQALGKDHSRVSVDALGAALTKEKFWGVQAEIAVALGTVGSPRAFQYLADGIAGIFHPKARAAAMGAVGTFRTEAAAELADRMLKEDASPLVQQAAGRALGASRAAGVFEKLQTAVGKRESWHDLYDVGITQGLGELTFDERALPILHRHARPGKSMFLRRAAVEALARWGRGRPSAVLETLMDLTRDENFFVRRNAILALEMLGDESAVGALRRVVDTAVEPRIRRAALIAIKGITAGRSRTDEMEKLRGDFDRLRVQYGELLGRIEKFEKTLPTAETR
jgi:aminopeptidase N